MRAYTNGSHRWVAQMCAYTNAKSACVAIPFSICFQACFNCASVRLISWMLSSDLHAPFPVSQVPAKIVFVDVDRLQEQTNACKELLRNLTARQSAEIRINMNTAEDADCITDVPCQVSMNTSPWRSLVLVCTICVASNPLTMRYLYGLKTFMSFV